MHRISEQMRDNMKSKMGIHISHDYCKGCSLCVSFCPKKVLDVSQELTRMGVYPPFPRHPEKCTGCMICQNICPDFAIYVEEIKETAHPV